MSDNNNQPQEIPGLAQYLPARPIQHPKGHCKECGNKIEGYHLEPDYKLWQPDLCTDCLNNKWDDDDDDYEE